MSIKIEKIINNKNNDYNNLLISLCINANSIVSTREGCSRITTTTIKIITITLILFYCCCY